MSNTEKINGARNSFKEYIEYIYPKYKFSDWNLETIEKLELVEKGQITHLLINLPPRHGKDFLMTLFQSWYLGKKGNTHNVYSTQYGESFIEQEVTEIIESDKFKEIFPEFTLIKEKNGQNIFNEKFGFSMSGRGYNLGIVGDLNKNRKYSEDINLQKEKNNWFHKLFSTKMQIDGAIIVIETRWNKNDLTGSILEKEKHGGDKYEKLIYPAISDNGEPLFFDKEYYEKKKKHIGEVMFESIYQQNPQ